MRFLYEYLGLRRGIYGLGDEITTSIGKMEETMLVKV